MTEEQQQPQRLKVINLFGAPGVGKSATRSGLFWALKLRGLSVEEVSEYAKYLVLSKRMWQLESDQLYVLAKQHHKLQILEGLYEFAITDSPLMLAGYYFEDLARHGKMASPSPVFANVCQSYAERFDNLNLFLTRDFKLGDFENRGRVHSADDSVRIDEEQKEFLTKKGHPFVEIDLDNLNPVELIGSMASQIMAKWPGSLDTGSHVDLGAFGAAFNSKGDGNAPV